LEKQIAIILSGTGGYLDDLPIEQCLPFELALYDFMDTSYPAVESRSSSRKKLLTPCAAGIARKNARRNSKKRSSWRKIKPKAEDKSKAEDKVKA